MDQTRHRDPLQRQVEDAAERGLRALEEAIRAPLGAPTAVTNSTSATWGDLCLVDPVDEDALITVPSPMFSDVGRMICVKHMSSSSYDAVISGGNSDVTIDGAADVTLTSKQTIIMIAVAPSRYIAFIGEGVP